MESQVDGGTFRIFEEGILFPVDCDPNTATRL